MLPGLSQDEMLIKSQPRTAQTLVSLQTGRERALSQIFPDRQRDGRQIGPQVVSAHSSPQQKEDLRVAAGLVSPSLMASPATLATGRERDRFRHRPDRSLRKAAPDPATLAA